MGSIVFFGSGPVSAATLEAIKNDFELEAVITKPSTLGQMSAAAGNSPTYAVSSARELDELVSSKNFHSPIGLVVDFGIVIARQTIDHFPLGIVNSHFSLLPKWRGADPISFAILGGDKKTGVSLMLIDQSLDTGKLLAQESIKLRSDHTTPDLTEDLIDLSNRMLKKYLPKYISGNISPYPQPENITPSHSKKLQKQDGIIDWNKPAVQIEREIRAYTGWPRTKGTIGSQTLIITEAKVVDETGKPGQYSADKNSLIVYCGEKALDIKTVQPPGKKEMTVSEFLRGHKLNSSG